MDYARAENLLGDSDEGDVARLQKALCAFYSGDISWARTQLEVLLKSTSKSIANDAMEFALLIAANSVEDTLMEGLMLIKDAMLLESQNRIDSAISAYESKLPLLLVHELYDDLLYRLGLLYERKGDYEQARNYFLQLKSITSNSMWKEEGLYYPAKMAYRLQLPSAQQELEDYLIAYPAGIFTEDARQFYRTFTL
jgi:tetratricopeptide (TPR) repeat protein